MHLHQEEPLKRDGQVTFAARIEIPGADPRSLWYRVPEEKAVDVTDSCDPFVIGSILMAMRESDDLVVHGAVSPSLIENLGEFQAVWSGWFPDKYKPIQIRADREVESPRSEENNAICAFTGGVDSAFTIWRHKEGLPKRWTRQIEAGLLVHGFDIPFEQMDAFVRASDKAAETLNSRGVKLVTMSSNHKELNYEWNDTHGVGVISCLSLFQKRYSYGIIAATHDLRDPIIPWGSNVVTDHFLSSDSFSVIHDAAKFGRLVKMKWVATWPEAFDNLRVCFSAQDKDKNCGRCCKCILTMIGFDYLDMALPKSFPTALSDEVILSVKDIDLPGTEELRGTIQALEGNGADNRWLGALKRCLRYNERKQDLSEPRSGKMSERLRKINLELLEKIGP